LPHAKSFFAIKPVNTLMIHFPALTQKQYVKAPVTIALTGCGMLTQTHPEGDLWVRNTLVADNTMKNIAYLRVSKQEQDISNQRLAILDYAHKNRFKIHKFVELNISSRRTPSERTKEGLAAARERGRLLGRPKGTLGKSKLDGKEYEI
jgi:hypothetical protein